MPIELIAEVSTNHGGDIALAKEFIHRFAEAGADWIKFQHTRVKHLHPNDPQYAWFQRAEFSLEQFAELRGECMTARVKFATTVFNHRDVPEVVSLCPDAIKVGSAEAGDAFLARALWTLPIRLIVSTGLHWNPCATAFKHRQPAPDYLKCVSRYPAPPELARTCYGRHVSGGEDWYFGYSDHCIGLAGCHIAIADGAQLIEKHVSLRSQARPIRPWEATIKEFKQLRAFADDDPSRMIGRWQHA